MADSLLQVSGKLILQTPSRSTHRRAPAIFMSQSRSYWASINADIEDHLRRAIPARQPLSVFEPMRHLVFSSPPTTAPALCIAACELVGGHRDQAMAAASALHLAHSAAFAHINLHSGAGADHPYGPNIRLLTGDGIAPFGYELLARSDDPTRNDSERVLRVVVEIARAMGPGGGELSVGGEKTEGRMHACGGACGAIMGGGSEEVIERMRRYGLIVGIRKGLLESEGVFGGKEKKMREKMEELRAMALKELESFGEKGHQISAFLDIQGF